MGLMNKAFVGMDVVDGASRTVKAFKNVDNKYDKILGGEIVKVPEANGQMNALNSNNPMYRSASEIIDGVFNLEKEAGIKDVAQKAVKAVGKAKSGLVDKAVKLDAEYSHDLAQLQRLKKLNKANGTPRVEERIKMVRKRLLKTEIPVGIAGVAGAAGVIKGVKSLDNSSKKYQKGQANDPIKDAGDGLYPYAAGAGLLGAATFDALAHKSVLAPVKHMGAGVRKGLYAYPKKLVGKAGKVGKMGVDLLKVIKKQIPDAQIKTASEEIDDVFFSKKAGINKELVKDIVKKDFVQEGLSSIPYMAIPAAMSYAVGKDIRHGGRKIRNTYDNKIVIDVPVNKLNGNEKTAAASPWGKYFKEDLPRKAVQGVSRSIFPAVVVAATGRNITNAMENVRDEDNKLPPVSPGNARITIQMDPEDTRKKKAFELIEVLYKEAKENPSSEPEKDAQQTVDSIGGKKKDPSTLASVRLASGIRKKQGMLG